MRVSSWLTSSFIWGQPLGSTSPLDSVNLQASLGPPWVTLPPLAHRVPLVGHGEKWGILNHVALPAHARGPGLLSEPPDLPGSLGTLQGSANPAGEGLRVFLECSAGQHLSFHQFPKTRDGLWLYWMKASQCPPLPHCLPSLVPE